MSEKEYTPVEAARKVLEKCQEVYNMHKSEKPKEMDKCGEISKEEDMSVEQAVDAIMGDKHGVDDVMAKLPKEKRAKVLASLRSKDAKKAEFCKGWMEKAEKSEMDKCGEMSKEEMNPKLKAFLEKRKQKKAQKMEKMMGIGEKMKPAAPAQSAAPVNAPKPPVAGMQKQEK